MRNPCPPVTTQEVLSMPGASEGCPPPAAVAPTLALPGVFVNPGVRPSPVPKDLHESCAFPGPCADAGDVGPPPICSSPEVRNTLGASPGVWLDTDGMGSPSIVPWLLDGFDPMPRPPGFYADFDYMGLPAMHAEPHGFDTICAPLGPCLYPLDMGPPWGLSLVSDLGELGPPPGLSLEGLVPPRPPPGLHSDRDGTGLNSAIPLPERPLTFPLPQKADDWLSGAYGTRAHGSTFCLRAEAPAFVPSEKLALFASRKEVAPAESFARPVAHRGRRHARRTKAPRGIQASGGQKLGLHVT